MEIQFLGAVAARNPYLLDSAARAWRTATECFSHTWHLNKRIDTECIQRSLNMPVSQMALHLPHT